MTLAYVFTVPACRPPVATSSTSPYTTSPTATASIGAASGNAATVIATTAGAVRHHPARRWGLVMAPHLTPAYINQRFTSAGDPRRAAIDEWMAGLRRRAEVIDLYLAR